MNTQTRETKKGIPANCHFYVAHPQGMRLLQLWLEKRLFLKESREIMTSLFVLYDLRIAYKHLLPSEKKEEYRLSSVSRLGLKEDATLEDLYTSLTESLER